MKKTKDFLWSIFGNDDEPEPPSWYVVQTPKYSTWFRWFVWIFVRNSLHNLTFYRWGIAGKPSYRTGDYPYDVMNPYGGWNKVKIFAGDRLYKFRSYGGRGFIKKFYWGYREKGNLGAKLNLNWWALFAIFK